ncbi:MAG: cysteine desulfurase-like protein [Acidobacteria bacterium]|nr:cysteine desulfurase-like protein [Acidobacteriota bacterium]MCW5968571.1 cysteine desulfurase-like protein [Blastocatellales bacterium]
MIEKIRSHFPALERTHNNLPVAYFDGPGGTQTPRPVADAMTDYLFHHNANTHWGYPSSDETDEIIAAGRATMADFFNASPDEIVFGPNMTTLTFHLARALGRNWSEGDEIVTTELDHHANIAPWQRLVAERGITVRTVRMLPETGTLDLEELERSITDRTRLLAIGAASNALGTINDVGRAAQLAHRAGALVFVDAVHYAAHELVDVKRLDCDFLACSAYKFYGPHLGVMFGRRELLAEIDFPKLRPAPDSAPERAETGTQNHEGIAGAAAAVEFLASLSEGQTRRDRLEATFNELHVRGKALIKQMWEGLAEIPGLTLYGPPPEHPRTPTVSFTVGATPSAEISRRLADRAIFASHGNFYAMTVAERLGKLEQGLLRAGCACYTTEEEVAGMVDCVREAV